MKITRGMSIAEVVDICPDAIDIFLEYGLHCVGCGASSWESIEDGAAGHGMDDELIDSLIADLNELLDQSQKIDTEERSKEAKI